jgi:squalene-hopene/tetraprenyl-beta-curcumene cyclase
VNYIYGTFLVLRGLEAIGIDHLEPQIQQAAEWIRMVQNPDGGWGETCGSYDDPNTRGVGTSTPSQTAWALLGLLAAGDDRSDSIAKGVRWLLTRQGAGRQLGRARGSWSYTSGLVHWNWLPKSFLPGIRDVSPILPAAGFDHLQAGYGTRRISTTAARGGYS